MWRREGRRGSLLLRSTSLVGEERVSSTTRWGSLQAGRSASCMPFITSRSFGNSAFDSDRRATRNFSCIKTHTFDKPHGHLPAIRNFVTHQKDSEGEQQPANNQQAQNEGVKQGETKLQEGDNTEGQHTPEEMILLFQDLRHLLALPMMAGLGAILVNVEAFLLFFDAFEPMLASIFSLFTATLSLAFVGQVGLRARRRVVGVAYRPETKEVVILRPRVLVPALSREVVPLRDFSSENPSLWEHYFYVRAVERKMREKKEKEMGFVMMGFHILNRGEDDQPSSARIANLGFSTNLADEGKVDVWTLDAVLRGQTPTPVTPAIYEAITSGFLTPDIPPPPGAQPPPLEYPEINQQK